jgi:hypothetical protein
MLIRGQARLSDLASDRTELSAVQGQPVLPGGEGGSSLKVGQRITLLLYLWVLKFVNKISKIMADVGIFCPKILVARVKNAFWSNFQLVTGQKTCVLCEPIDRVLLS